MNTTHFHLLLNHFPIVGTLVGSGLLLWGILKNQDNIKAISSFILVIMALIAIPVYLTGEPSEETVENLPGVAKSMIEMHEEAATIAIWLMGITALAAMIALVFNYQKKQLSKAFFLTAFLLSALCFAAMARTGYYGGQIRHSEIRSGASTDSQDGPDQKNSESDKDKSEEN
ncbi:hypothetical protein BH10BAC3_BH10BAC3_00010 [soil metagenome]